MGTTIDSADYAPNWDQNQVLTWSGRWHIASPNDGPARDARTLCGSSGYQRDYVPRGRKQLQAIKWGLVEAPMCKKCDAAARKAVAS